MKRNNLRVLTAFYLLPTAYFLAGCTTSHPSTQPVSASDPGDSALQDPFSYGKHWDNPDISGGSLTNFDSKAMKRDVDDVLNP